jgi:hypothetical protein
MWLSYSRYTAAMLAVSAAVAVCVGAPWVVLRSWSLNTVEFLMFMKREWIRSHFVTEERPCKLVFIFGDSTIVSGLRPAILQELSQNTWCVYNLAQISHDISKYWFLLKEALKQNRKPDLILVGLSSERKGVFVDGRWAEYREAFPQRNYFEYLRDRYAGTSTSSGVKRFVENGWDRARVRALRKQMVDERGAYWSAEGSLPANFQDNDDRPDREDMPKYSLEYMTYIERFFRLAEEIGAPTIIIEEPQRVGMSSQRACMPAAYKIILKTFPGARIASNGWRFHYYPPKMFFDRGHLNREGADVYSRDTYNDITLGEMITADGPWPCLR